MKLMPEYSSSANKLDPHHDQIWTLLPLKKVGRHKVIEQRTLFGVVHDDRYETLVQTMIQFGIPLPAICNSSRDEVIVHCILFDVEHDERNYPAVSTR